MTSKATSDFNRLINGAGYAWHEESRLQERANPQFGGAAADSKVPVSTGGTYHQESKKKPTKNAVYGKQVKKKLTKLLRGGPKGGLGGGRKEDVEDDNENDDIEELSLAHHIRKAVTAVKRHFNPMSSKRHFNKRLRHRGEIVRP